jgi:hypothetical protein
MDAKVVKILDTNLFIRAVDCFFATFVAEKNN